MNPPTVSVVTGVYQAAAHVRTSLQSVLAEQEAAIELIVVDDGSTDGTRQILHEIASADGRVRVLEQAHEGLTAALVHGCAEARGEFIARHDGDDVSFPGRLERQVELLQRNAALALVSCWAKVLGPQDEPLYEIRRSCDAEQAARALREGGEGPPGHGSVMFRTEAYRQVGGYRAAFRYAQDHDLWLRLIERGGVGYVPDFLYAFRVSEISISAQRRSQQLRLAALARRCAAARDAGQPEAPWLQEAARVSAEPAPPSSRSDPGNSYFIGKCLFDRRDVRCLSYLRRAVRERPSNWRAWAALMSAQRFRRSPRPKAEERA